MHVSKALDYFNPLLLHPVGLSSHPPLDWGNLMCSAASQNSGMVQHVLSKQSSPGVQRTKL